MKYSEFLSMSKNVTEKAGTGSEPFLSTFMKPMKKDVDLPTEVLELLVEYYYNAHTSNEKNLQKSAILFGTKAMHIYKSTVLFLPILGYFCLFLPICESVVNLHESTLLFAPNIHAYFCLFFVI